jgi:anti-anti-sigma factor
MKVAKSRIMAEITSDHAVVHFLPTHVRDLSDVQKIMDEIEEVAYNHNVKVLVLNFGRLKQMTSSFLSKLISLNKSLKQAGIALRVCSMSAEVSQAFKICKLDKLIPVFDDEDKALAG